MTNGDTEQFMKKNDVINHILELKKYVKESNINGQNHLDVSLVDANDRDVFYKNITILQKAIQQNILTEKEYKELLGI
jgi:hypothetical protein